jgi:hypothetical protein
MPKSQKDLKIGIPGCKTSLEVNTEMTLKSIKKEPRNRDEVVFSSVTLIRQLNLAQSPLIPLHGYWRLCRTESSTE